MPRAGRCVRRSSGSTSAGRRSASASGALGLAVQAGRRRGAVEHFRAQAEVNWWPRSSRRSLRRPTRCCCFPASQPPPDRPFLSTRWGAALPTCRSTTSACAGPRRATGNGRRWRYAASSCRSCSAGRAARRDQRRGQPAHRHSARPSVDRRGGRQGLRGASAQVRWSPPSPASPIGTTATINTTRARYLETGAADSTLSGGDSRSFQYRGDDLSRLLDGQLVQREFGLREMQQACEQGSSRSNCSTNWSTACRPARWA